MKSIVACVADYLRWLNKSLLFGVVVVLSVLIFINYRYGVADIVNGCSFFKKFLLYDALFVAVFTGCWFASLEFRRNTSGSKIAAPRDHRFYVMLAIAPAIFAVKVALPVQAIVAQSSLPGELSRFLQIVAQWPAKAIVVIFFVAWLWKYSKSGPPFAGLASLKADRIKPYLLLLLLMLPLLVVAGTLSDFQKAYPKLQLIGSWQQGDISILRAILFEFSYGLDFFTIEFFFRGFLILAFARFAGKAAILPMAAFYCTIHFGKPLGECISSFMGGIILGAVVYHTRSIWGGLIVHLGIAWAMEAVGLIM